MGLAMISVRNVSAISIKFCKHLKKQCLEAKCSYRVLKANVSSVNVVNESSESVCDFKKYKKDENCRHGNNYIHIKLHLLHSIGLQPHAVANFAKDFSKVFQLEVNDIEQHVQTFRNYSFDNHYIKMLIEKHPWVLLVPLEKICSSLNALLRITEITRPELQLLCTMAPTVLVDKPDQTTEKYHYLHFTMGKRDYSEMFSCGLFNYSLKYIEQRHVFLSRRAQYVLPSRHGSSRIENPSLANMFCSSTSEFCKSVAKCDESEYDLFLKLFEIEKKYRNEGDAEETEDINEIMSNDDRNSFADQLLKNL